MSSTVDLFLLGDSGVGLTSLKTRFADDMFLLDTPSTITVEFKEKKLEIDGEMVQVRVWEVTGQTKSVPVRSSYIKKADGVICVFSLENSNSFDEIEFWINFAKENAIEGTPIYLVGNKADIAITLKDRIEELIERLGLRYFKVSAKTGENVEKVFTEIARDALRVKRAKEVNLQQPEEQTNKCF